MCLVYGAIVALLVFVIGGLDDELRRRREARAELARARAQHHVAPAAAYREAHAHMHRAARHLLGRVPAPRDGSDR